MVQIMAWHQIGNKPFSEPMLGYCKLTKKFCILLEISRKFVPKGPVYNNPALVKIMAWRRIGDKPFSELRLT